jgi:predicted O-methyltransferase YrrM
MVSLKKWGVSWNRDIGKSGLDWQVERETADFLYGFTRMIKPQRVLEIGTFEGLGSTAIAKAMRENEVGKLWTIDIKEYGQTQTMENEGLSDIVTCLIGDATEALLLAEHGQFDFTFVDDGHSFEDASRDLRVSHKLIRRFGYILGHDILSIPTVDQAVNSFLEGHKGEYEKTIVASYCGLFILRKL